MKKLILFIILVLFIPIYLFAQECDYIFTDDEIKNNELDNLLSGGIYKNKKASGIYCAKLEDIVELQFKMKNGKSCWIYNKNEELSNGLTQWTNYKRNEVELNAATRSGKVDSKAESIL